VAPVVESITSGAAAASAPGSALPEGQAFSYVTLLLETSGSYYRYKFSFGESSFGESITQDFGAKPADGNFPTPDPTLIDPSGYNYQIVDRSTTAYPSLSHSYTVTSGSPTFTITNNTTLSFTVVAWVVHNGNCYASLSNVTLTPTTYKGAPTTTGFSSGATVTFVAPGNTRSC